MAIELDVQAPSGDPFGLVLQFTDAGGNPASTVTSPTVIVMSSATEETALEALVLPGGTGQWGIFWTAAQTAQMGTFTLEAPGAVSPPTSLRWALRALVSGAGPYTLLAGQLAMRDFTQPLPKDVASGPLTIGPSLNVDVAFAYPLAAPADVVAVPGAAQVVLSWRAPASGPSGPYEYAVYRGSAPGGEGATPITTTSATSYTDTDVTPGEAYYYQVAAFSSSSVSALSAEESATPTGTVPGPPSNLAATSGPGTVDLSWTAPTSDGGLPVTSYNVYQGTSSGAGTFLANATGTDYTATGLTNGTEYFFYVTAVNSVGEGAGSNEANATPATVPGAPTGLTATVSSGQIVLSWMAPASDGGSPVSSYNIYMGTSSGGEGRTPTASSTTTTSTTPALTPGTTYYFEVTAVNAIGESAKSNEVSANTGITLVAAGDPLYAGDVISPSFGQPTTAGNLLVAFVWANGASTPPACSDPSWTYALDGGMTFFYKADCAADETPPTFSASGAPYMTAQLAEFAGVATTAPLVTASGSGAGPAAGTVSDPNAGCLVLGASVWNGTNVQTAITVTCTDSNGDAIPFNIIGQRTNTANTPDVFVYGVTTQTGSGTDTYGATENVYPGEGANILAVFNHA